MMGLERIGKRRTAVCFRALAWMRTWPAQIRAGLIYAVRPALAELHSANQPASSIELYSGAGDSNNNNNGPLHRSSAE